MISVSARAQISPDQIRPWVDLLLLLDLSDRELLIHVLTDLQARPPHSFTLTLSEPRR